eukprot:TRINITY_DN10785_c0_g1_i1.p1 TRINITY_DN10785_c0_g1~~TRINITY_DN10785_c0_g1_i1.p1  ORF type:complete len:187 (-),score=-8.26 TRINITY_DN10785_c0_g1_i1:399-959(-)
MNFLIWDQNFEVKEYELCDSLNYAGTNCANSTVDVQQVMLLVWVIHSCLVEIQIRWYRNFTQSQTIINFVLSKVGQKLNVCQWLYNQILKGVQTSQLLLVFIMLGSCSTRFLNLEFDMCSPFQISSRKKCNNNFKLIWNHQYVQIQQVSLILLVVIQMHVQNIIYIYIYHELQYWLLWRVLYIRCF